MFIINQLLRHFTTSFMSSYCYIKSLKNKEKYMNREEQWMYKYNLAKVYYEFGN